MNLSLRPHLPLLLAALGSGVVSWFALSRMQPHSAATVTTASVETLSATETDQKPLPPALSGAGTAEFLAALRTATPGELRQTWLFEYDLARRNAVIARWASVDPRGCWEFLKSQSLGRATDYTLVANAYPLLFDIWMRSDHAAARDAYIQQTKEGIEGAVALSTLVRSASLTGGEAWSALLSDPRFAGFSVTNWGNSSPVLLGDATDTLRQMESYAEAEKQGRIAFLNACQADSVTAGISPESALSAYQALSAQGRSDYGESLGRSLAKQDVAKGAAIVEGLPPGERGKAAQGRGRG